MALAFVQIAYTQRVNLLEEFGERVKVADENREKENRAAGIIARCWMAYAARKRVIFLRENIIKIQKSFRGALGRKLFENRLKTLARDRRMAVYNKSATIIQRMWRGVYYRTCIFDFYKRQLYLKHVAAKAEETRKELAEFERARLQETKIQQELARQQEKERLAHRLHHLISTKSITGVLVAKKHRNNDAFYRDLTEEYMLKANHHRIHAHASSSQDLAHTATTGKRGTIKKRSQPPPPMRQEHTTRVSSILPRLTSSTKSYAMSAAPSARSKQYSAIPTRPTSNAAPLALPPLVSQQ